MRLSAREYIETLTTLSVISDFDPAAIALDVTHHPSSIDYDFVTFGELY